MKGISKSSLRSLKKRTRKILKGILVPLCLAGFCHATYLVMKIYWMYPVVIDIQTIKPSEILIPSISLCNSNGIYPLMFCPFGAICLSAYLLRLVDACETYAGTCGTDGGYAADFVGITYDRVMKNYTFTPKDMAILRKPLSDFLTCKIISGNEERDCNTEDAIIGSYFNSDSMFGLCYVLYSKWSRPDVKLEKLKKTDKIVLEAYLDKTDRDRSLPLDLERKPKYNYPVSPILQFSVHNNEMVTSPFASGVTLSPGKKYQIRLKQESKRLLPAPYQTNCTDYRSGWISRGGVGPLNALMLVEECKYNRSLEELGCVPFSIDYVHNDSVCKYCPECEVENDIMKECSKLLGQYNQPCEFTSIDMKIKEKIVYVEKEYVNLKTGTNETMRFTKREHDCRSLGKPLTRRCQMLSIEILFDDFTITNISYNPKLESNDIISAIGGYMGIYLGISIASSYDFIIKIFNFARSVYKKLKKKEAKKARLFEKRKTRNNSYLRENNSKVHPL